MGLLCYHGSLSPADFSDEIRARGISWAQARRLEREIVKLRKQDIEFQQLLVRSLQKVIALAGGLRVH